MVFLSRVSLLDCKHCVILFRSPPPETQLISPPPQEKSVSEDNSYVSNYFLLLSDTKTVLFLCGGFTINSFFLVTV